MKKFLPLVAVGMLAACGSPADDTDQVIVDDTAVIEPAANDGAAGVYEVTMPDGTVATETVNEDGTYETVANGNVIETGTWRTDGNEMCEDPEGPAPEQCYAGSEPGADGSFTVQTDDGTMTIRKVG